MTLGTSARVPLTNLGDDALVRRAYQLRHHDRRVLVDLLLTVAEMEQRKTIIDQGFPSLFSFLNDGLRFPKASAYRRTVAARLVARFPLVADYLLDGRLNLTTLVYLREVLDEAHLREILERAANQTEDQVKQLVATLRPQRPPAPLLRKLPTHGNHSGGSGPEPAAATTGPPPPSAPSPPAQATSAPSSPPLLPADCAAATAPPPPLAAGSSLPVPSLPAPAASPPSPAASPPSPAASSPAPPPPPPPPPPAAASPGLATAPSAPRPATIQSRLEPIAPTRHLLRVAVSDDFVADLAAARQALSHKLPAGRLEDVLHECVRFTLESVERRRRGAGKKKWAKLPPEDSRYVPAAVRYEVWQRDGGQCTFVSSSGRRCPSRHRIEFHHLKPWALGGRPTVDNITLRCAVHNRRAAEQDFGDQHIAAKIAARRKPLPADQSACPAPNPADIIATTTTSPHPATLQAAHAPGPAHNIAASTTTHQPDSSVPAEAPPPAPPSPSSNARERTVRLPEGER